VARHSSLAATPRRRIAAWQIHRITASHDRSAASSSFASPHDHERMNA
jgi:hypothetical protein